MPGTAAEATVIQEGEKSETADNRQYQRRRTDGGPDDTIGSCEIVEEFCRPIICR